MNSSCLHLYVYTRPQQRPQQCVPVAACLAPTWWWLLQVFDFLESLEEFAYPRYSLVSNFPRRVYDASCGDMSLQDAGLSPQGALFVQPD